MKDESLDPHVRASNTALLLKKRDELLSERKRLATQRSELLSAMRKNDRDISDCRAAARFLDVALEFPDDDERSSAERAMFVRMEREREIEAMERERRNRLIHEARIVSNAVAPTQQALNFIPAQPSAAVITTSPAPKARPAIRDILLDQLKLAGESGSKAAPLRDFIERTYGETIHEKTVGMTLYRLQKEGLVTRNRHTWFFASPSAETNNPGVGAPGSTSTEQP